MESCKSETAAKGGWTQQEDRLLLSAAQAARQDGRALTQAKQHTQLLLRAHKAGRC